MKKIILILFIAVGMTGVAHAVETPPIDTADLVSKLNADQAALTAQENVIETTNALPAGTYTSGSSNTGGPSGFVALAPIPGLTDAANTSVVDSKSLANFFNNLYKYLIGLAATLAVIMIIWGGLEISTKDSVSKQSDGRERIYQAIIGLVLVLSPVLVFSIINPAILNLSINLPALDTKSGPPATTAPTTQSATLTESETTLRESAGGNVVFVFTVASGMSARDLGNTLDGKQNECTQTTGGRGIILPQGNVGGGQLRYVCQTCPPASTVILLPKGNAGSGARGACQS